MSNINKSTTGQVTLVNGKGRITYKILSPLENVTANVVCNISEPIDKILTDAINLSMLSGAGNNGDWKPGDPNGTNYKPRFRIVENLAQKPYTLTVEATADGNIDGQMGELAMEIYYGSKVAGGSYGVYTSVIKNNVWSVTVVKTGFVNSNLDLYFLDIPDKGRLKQSGNGVYYGDYYEYYLNVYAVGLNFRVLSKPEEVAKCITYPPAFTSDYTTETTVPLLTDDMVSLVPAPRRFKDVSNSIDYPRTFVINQRIGGVDAIVIYRNSITKECLHHSDGAAFIYNVEYNGLFGNRTKKIALQGNYTSTEVHESKLNVNYENYDEILVILRNDPASYSASADFSVNKLKQYYCKIFKNTYIGDRLSDSTYAVSRPWGNYTRYCVYSTQEATKARVMLSAYLEQKLNGVDQPRIAINTPNTVYPLIQKSYYHINFEIVNIPEVKPEQLIANSTHRRIVIETSSPDIINSKITSKAFDIYDNIIYTVTQNTPASKVDKVNETYSYIVTNNLGKKIKNVQLRWRHMVDWDDNNWIESKVMDTSLNGDAIFEFTTNYKIYQAKTAKVELIVDGVRQPLTPASSYFTLYDKKLPDPSTNV